MTLGLKFFVSLSLSKTDEGTLEIERMLIVTLRLAQCDNEKKLNVSLSLSKTDEGTLEIERMLIVILRLSSG